MPEFNIEKVKVFLDDIDIAVETGTFRGGGTRVMSENFEKVITIELDPILYEETKSTMCEEGYTNVDFVLGDSATVIADIAKTVKDPVMFYLDAHWSGDSTVNWSESEWKGYNTNTAHKGKSDKPTSQEQVPLDIEVKVIARYFEPKGIIYIDDLDKFSITGEGLKDKAFKGEDYSHLNLKMFREYLGTRLRTWKNLKNQQLIIQFDKIPTTAYEIWKQKLYYNTIFKLNFYSNQIFFYLRWKFKGK